MAGWPDFFLAQRDKWLVFYSNWVPNNENYNNERLLRFYLPNFQNFDPNFRVHITLKIVFLAPQKELIWPPLLHGPHFKEDHDDDDDGDAVLLRSRLENQKTLKSRDLMSSRRRSEGNNYFQEDFFSHMLSSLMMWRRNCVAQFIFQIGGISFFLVIACGVTRSGAVFLSPVAQ